MILSLIPIVITMFIYFGIAISPEYNKFRWVYVLMFVATLFHIIMDILKWRM